MILQVQRLRPPPSSESFSQNPITFLRPGVQGPQLIPPPPKPQPVVLSAAPKLYKQPKEDLERKEKESRKRVYIILIIINWHEDNTGAKKVLFIF